MHLEVERLTCIINSREFQSNVLIRLGNLRNSEQRSVYFQFFFQNFVHSFITYESQRLLAHLLV